MTDLIKAKRTLLAAIRNADITGVRKSDLTVESIVFSPADGEPEFHATFRGEETVFIIDTSEGYGVAIEADVGMKPDVVEDEFHCDGCNETDPLFRSSLKNLCVNCHADS